MITYSLNFDQFWISVVDFDCLKIQQVILHSWTLSKILACSRSAKITPVNKSTWMEENPISPHSLKHSYRQSVLIYERGISLIGGFSYTSGQYYLNIIGFMHTWKHKNAHITYCCWSCLSRKHKKWKWERKMHNILKGSLIRVTIHVWAIFFPEHRGY